VPFLLFSRHFAGSFEEIKRLIYEGISTVASTASEYPLADFSYFQVPCPKMKNACWENPKPFADTEERYAQQNTKYPDEILGHGGRKTAH
jgi:hypothetical protein